MHCREPWPLMRTKDKSRRRRRTSGSPRSLSLIHPRLYIIEWGREVVPLKTRPPPPFIPNATDNSEDVEGFFYLTVLVLWKLWCQCTCMHLWENPNPNPDVPVYIILFRIMQTSSSIETCKFKYLIIWFDTFL